METEMLIGFFGWMSVINSVLLALAIVLVLMIKGFMCKLHGKLFGLSAQQINMATYCFVGLYKILIFMFNIIPYVAMKIVAG